MFLTPEDIAALTLKTQRKSQRAALNFMGIDHKIRPDGSIVVLRAHVEKVLGASMPISSAKKREPNWSAI
jgi:hypothetical protein